MKSILIFFCLCLFGNLARAQFTTITQANITAINSCQSSGVFELTVNNTSSNDLNSVFVQLSFPSSVITFNNVSSALISDANPNNPIFSIPDISANQQYTFSFELVAGCGALDLGAIEIKNSVTVSYLYGSATIGGDTYETNSYNINSPNLLLTVGSIGSPNTNVAFNSYFSPLAPGPQSYRQIIIQNGSAGPTDKVILTIRPEIEIEYVGFYNEANVLISPTVLSLNTNGEIVLELTGSTLASCVSSGDGDNLFESGEIITINEGYRVTKCDPNPNSILSQTKYKATWSCQGVSCGPDQGINVNLNIGAANANNPEIAVTIPNAQAVTNYCGSGDRLTFVVKNTQTSSADNAYNINFNWLFHETGITTDFPTSFALSDFEINGIPIGETGITFTPAVSGTTTAWQNSTTLSHYFNIDLRTNTDDRVASNLDGDEFFDDLLPQQEFTITAKITFNDVIAPDDCNEEFIARFGFLNMNYETACGVNRTFSSAETAIYEAKSLNGASRTLADGPTDLTSGETGTYKFCTKLQSVSLDFFDCPTNLLIADVTLPDGYQFEGTTATWISDYSPSIPETTSTKMDLGNNVIRFEINNNIPNRNVSQYSGCLTLDLKMDCSFASAGSIPQSSAVAWNLKYLCDNSNSCSILEQRACSSFTTYNHTANSPSCTGGPTCDGILTTGFDVKRTSLGWTDHTRANLINPDTDPLINIHSAYPLDEVQSKTTGILNNKNFDQLFVRIWYDGPQELFTWTGGTINLYEVGGTVPMTSCPAPPPIVSSHGSGFNVDFDLGPILNNLSLCISSLSVNRTLEIVNNWRVAAIVPADTYPMKSFRSGFYMRTNSTDVFCDHYGAAFELIRHRSYGQTALFNTSTYDCGEIHAGLLIRKGGGRIADDFPHEFRNNLAFDGPMQYDLPEGYSYINGSATTFAYNGYDAGGNPTFVREAITSVSESNGTITFDHLWPIVDESQKSVDDAGPILFFKLKPQCDRTISEGSLLSYNFHRNDYLTNSTYHFPYSESDGGNPAYSGNPPNNITVTNRKPNLKIEDLTTNVLGLENEIKWTFKINNYPDATNEIANLGRADNVWIDLQELITNEGNILITNVRETSINQPVNVQYYLSDFGKNSAYVQVGSILKNSELSFEVTASYSNCASNIVDNVSVAAGWNCTAYPSLVELPTASCQVGNTQLSVTYQSSQLDAAINFPPSSSSLCAPIPIEFTLTNSANSFIYDIDTWVDLPVGAIITDAEYRFTSSGTWTALAPGVTTGFGTTTSGNMYGWHLSDEASELDAFNHGLPGIVSNQGNQLFIKFNLIPSCDYIVNESLKLHTYGLTNCGEAIENNFVRQILINGLSDTEDLSLAFNTPTNAAYQTPTDIQIIVTNNGNAPSQAGNQIQVTVPTIFDIVSVTGGTSSAQVATWELIPSLAPGESRTFTLTVSSQNAAECATFNFPTEISRTTQTTCGASTCDVVVLGTQATTSIEACCPPPVLDCKDRIIYTNYDECGELISTKIGLVADLDNGCGVLTATHDHVGQIFPLGITPVTWTVTTASNEVLTCVQNIIFVLPGEPVPVVVGGNQ